MSNGINRPLPFNIEAEEALLGSLILNADGIVQVLPLLKTQDFYRQKHAWLYDVLVTLHQRQVAPDFVTITDELERRNQFRDFGGHAALSKLIMRVPSAIHLDHYIMPFGYARIIERDAKKRQLLGVAERIAKMVYEEKETALRVPLGERRPPADRASGTGNLRHRAASPVGHACTHI